VGLSLAPGRNVPFQFISVGGYPRKTLAAVIKIWWVTVRGGNVSPASSRRASGSTLKELAKSYNVGISTIRRATRTT
jgi:hypothetical protein